MRVIGGMARGRRLARPRGVRVRPTSDRLREALFSMLEAHQVDLERTVDLYAGSGALGIEALSRGAGQVHFVERERRCCETIKANLRHLGYQERGYVHCVPVSGALERLEGPFTLILLDPPYGSPELETVLARIATSPLVEEGTVVAVEHSPRQALAAGYGALVLGRHRRHGDSCISLYELGGTIW